MYGKKEYSLFPCVCVCVYIHIYVREEWLRRELEGGRGSD